MVQNCPTYRGSTVFVITTYKARRGGLVQPPEHLPTPIDAI